MATGYNTTLRNTRLDAITTALDAGATVGRLRIKTDGAVLLANLPLNNPAAAGAAAGVLTIDCTPTLTAGVTAAGTAGYYELTDSDLNVVRVGNVATTAAGGANDLKFASITWVTGGTVNVTAAAITEGNATA